MQTIEVTSDSLFQSLADSTRIRIVRLLASTKEEICLCELSDSLNEPDYKLSRHMKILKQAGLVLAERDGRWVYHRLVVGPEYLRHFYTGLCALPDINNTFAQDLIRFKKQMRLREKNGRCGKNELDFARRLSS